MACVFFEKTELAWNAQEVVPAVWKNLEAFDPSAMEAIERLNLFDQTPICKKLDFFNSKMVIRPAGSYRAFYIRLVSGGVLAIKGSEIRNSNLQRALEEDAHHKLPNRPWTRFENFLFHEQKLPLSLSLHEALEESSAAAQFQSGMIQTFGGLELAPVPLFVHKWPEHAVAEYVSTIMPYLNTRARNLAKPLIEEYGLGASIYYYQHVPYRIRFSLPEAATDFNSRLREMMRYKDTEKSCNPQSAVEKLLDVTTKMLMLGYLPFSFHDHGIGQCIAPQNVTLKGGLTDMQSLFSFHEVRSDREFHELFISMIVMLSATIREFLVAPLPALQYEFGDPSVLSALLSNYVWDRLRFNFTKYNAVIKVDIDPRLEKLLSQGSTLRPSEIIEQLYPRCFRKTPASPQRKKRSR